MTQKQIQEAFAAQLAVSTKMTGDPFEGQSVIQYAEQSLGLNPEDAEHVIPRLIAWRDECAAHQGQARLHYFGEVAGQPLQVYYIWEQELETMHDTWELVNNQDPDGVNMPRLRKKVA